MHWVRPARCRERGVVTFDIMDKMLILSSFVPPLAGAFFKRLYSTTYYVLLTTHCPYGSIRPQIIKLCARRTPAGAWHFARIRRGCACDGARRRVPPRIRQARPDNPRHL